MAAKPSTIVVVEKGTNGKVFRCGGKNIKKLRGYFNDTFGVFVSRPSLGEDFDLSMMTPEARDALTSSRDLDPEWFEAGDQLRIPVGMETFEAYQS